MLSGATSNEDRLYMKSSSGHICHEGHLVFHSTVHEHVQKSGSRAPHINFDTWWKWVIIFTLWPLYP